MFGSFSALSTVLSGALDKRIRVLERARSFGEGERERWAGKEKEGEREKRRRKIR